MGSLRTTWREGDQALVSHKTQLQPRYITMAHGAFQRREQSVKFRFFLSSQYLRGIVEVVTWARAIWISRGIPRQSFHAWLVALNRIPTRDRLIGWGLQFPLICLLCNTTDESRDHLYWGCNFSYQLWSLVASRCRINPLRSWESSLNQMKTLPPPNKTRSLTLLGWQATIYWIWNERNQHLHANRFRSVDSLFSSIDHQVRNKIQSFRESHPTRCSEMMQLWIC